MTGRFCLAEGRGALLRVDSPYVDLGAGLLLKGAAGRALRGERRNQLGRAALAEGRGARQEHAHDEEVGEAARGARSASGRAMEDSKTPASSIVESARSPMACRGRWRTLFVQDAHQ